MLRKGKTFAGGAVSKSLKFDRKSIFFTAVTGENGGEICL